MKKTAKNAAVSLCLAMGALAAAPAHAQMYWRTEVGYSKPNNADYKDNDFPRAGAICSNSSCTNPSSLDNVDGSLFFGGGVGYRFTNSLRGDVTLAYRGQYYLCDRTSEAEYRASISSTTVMVNGYHDFIVGGVRPYLGAGIGVARNDTGTMSKDFRLGWANRFTGEKRSNTAFALMAGIGIPYAGWTLDIGYRYIDLGKFGNVPQAAAGISSGQVGRLLAHEFTIGTRF